MSGEQIQAAVQKWLETVVIGLNLCPFARKELVKNRVRFVVVGAETQEALLQDLQSELMFLQRNTEIETTLLIHPEVLRDFATYNQFLNDADDLLMALDLDGVYQVASFHPDYQFAGTDAEDAENYTNRAPYPLLHILRESSLERAIAEYPDAASIPEQNIVALNAMGREKASSLLQRCLINEAK